MNTESCMEDSSKTIAVPQMDAEEKLQHPPKETLQNPQRKEY